MATAAIPGKAAPAPAKPIAYDERRLEEAEINQGTRLLLTLPGSETVPEGEQDIDRWCAVGPRLHIGTWLEITNDDRTWWVLCRVEMLHGGRGAGLRGLRLRYLIPPHLAEREAEPPVANGSWHVHYGGTFKKWMIIHPSGQVRAGEISSETEAKNRCIEMERNSGVYRR